MSSPHVHQSEELKVALSSFVARNEVKHAVKRAEVQKRDQCFSSSEEEIQFKAQLNAAPVANKPVLKKTDNFSSQERAEAKEDLAEIFKGLVRLAQGSLETQLKGQEETSKMTRQTGTASLKSTQIALTKQGDLLVRQNTLNEKIQKTGGLLGTMNTVFMVLGFAPAIIGALSGIGSLATAGYAAAVGAGEAAGEGAASAAVADAASSVASNAAANGLANGAAEQALATGEEAASKAGAEALKGGVGKVVSSEEGSSSLQGIVEKLKNPRTVLGFAGRIQGITPLYLTARFQKQISEQHFQLAEDVESVGKAMEGMSQMKSVLTFFQQATMRLSGTIDQMAGQSAEIVKSAKEVFKNRVTMSNFMAQAV